VLSSPVNPAGEDRRRLCGPPLVAPGGVASAPDSRVLEVDQELERIKLMSRMQAPSRLGCKRYRSYSVAPPQKSSSSRRSLLGELARELSKASWPRPSRTPPVLQQIACGVPHGERPYRECRASGLARGEAGLSEFLAEDLLPLETDARPDGRGTRRCLVGLGRAALEWKVDGARIQVHRDGDEVRIYTRQLNEITQACPSSWRSRAAFP